jgi:hypothetical protein
MDMYAQIGIEHACVNFTLDKRVEVMDMYVWGGNAVRRYPIP